MKKYVTVEMILSWGPCYDLRAILNQAKHACRTLAKEVERRRMSVAELEIKYAGRLAELRQTMDDAARLRADRDRLQRNVDRLKEYIRDCRQLDADVDRCHICDQPIYCQKHGDRVWKLGKDAIQLVPLADFAQQAQGEESQNPGDPT